MAHDVFLRFDPALTPRARLDGWAVKTLRTKAEVTPVLEAVTRAMQERCFSEDDVFETRLALDEAICNAIRHGHRDDPTKEVRVRYQVTADRAIVEVEDQGEGFDPDRVADPLGPERIGEPGGRGLLLMRTLATDLVFNARGNRVTFVRRRSTLPWAHATS
jgi:serine/threonine-protein kinase RsbW